MRNNLQAALDLAARSWRVVPLHSPDGRRCDCHRDGCPSPAKHPRINDWVRNASSAHADVERWWQQWPHANVGVATGPESGVVVLDIDPRHGGDQELSRLCDEHELLPPGPACETGGGGQHYYFRHPGGKVRSRTIAPGIDVKGDGGQVVAPPSVHQSGMPYEWYDEAGPDLPLPVIPPWLLMMMAGDDDHPFGDGPETRVLPADVAPGERNNTLAKWAGVLRHRGASERVIFKSLSAINDEWSQPLEQGEVAQIAASIAKHEPGEAPLIVRTQDQEQRQGGARPHREVYVPHPFSAAELEHMEIEPVKWAVPGLLPQGLALLAGRPKIGKSWLSFNIGVAVAQGGIALGDLPVEDGDVLILALEDTKTRLKSRMKVLMQDEPFPDRLYFEHRWPRQNEGGVAAIDAWLGQHPQARLVVIDTLAKFKAIAQPGAKRGDVYAEDYAVAEEFQELAGRHGVAILLITHYNKAFNEDWLNSVTGSTGTTGAADTILGLERPRGAKGQQEAILHVTGRDIEEQDYGVVFDGARGRWTITGDAASLRAGRETADLLKVMTQIAHPVTPEEIAAAMSKTRPAAYKLLYRAAMNGYILSHGGRLFSTFEPENAARTHPIGVGVLLSVKDGNGGQTDIRTQKDTWTSSDTGQQSSFESSQFSPQTGAATSHREGAISETKTRTNGKPAMSAAVLGHDITRPSPPCPTCGDYAWTLRVGGRWMCDTCHPAVRRLPYREDD